MKIVNNFDLIRTNGIATLLQNRAFLYGDGLFETMIYQNGKVNFLPDHLMRLSDGMIALSMHFPLKLTLSYLKNTIPQLAQENGLAESARVKLQVCRKPGGLFTPTEQEADFYLSVFPLPTSFNWIGFKEEVLFYRDIRLYASKISLYKTCSALPYVMAGIAKKEAEADDMILLDVYGNVAECTASNIFWMKRGKLYTPSLASGCIAGIMRKQLLLRAAQLKITVVEGLFTEQDLLEAEGVFCSNVAGIQLIKKIEETQFNPEKVPQELITFFA